MLAWCDLNTLPLHYECTALPIELHANNKQGNDELLQAVLTRLIAVHVYLRFCFVGISNFTLFQPCGPYET